MVTPKKTAPKKVTAKNSQGEKNKAVVLIPEISNEMPGEPTRFYELGTDSGNIPEIYYPEIKGYIKNNTITFPAIKDFTKEFVNNAKEHGMEMFMRGSNENSVVISEDKGEVEISFGKFELRMFRDLSNGMNFETGVMYDLTGAKPIIKAYTGTRVRTCLNMCVFSADEVVKNEFSNWKNIIEWANTKLLSQVDKIAEHERKIHEMKSLRFSSETVLYQLMGEMIAKSFGETHGHQIVVSGYKSLLDRKSAYHINFEDSEEMVKKANFWNVFNAMTDEISNSDKFFDNAEKTQSCYRTLMEIGSFANSGGLLL